MWKQDEENQKSVKPEEIALRSDYVDNDTESTTSDATSCPDQEQAERGVWKNNVEFFLAIMGYTVGLGSVWRFPIILSRNGGGAFLIPFFTLLILAGGPLYYYEVCLGQFIGKSPLQAFQYCPLLKGIGFLQVFMSMTVVWYLMFISAYIYYYIYASFFTVLPWTTCNNEWNTPDCVGLYSNITTTNVHMNHTNGTELIYNTSLAANASHLKTSSYEFWTYNVINRSEGLEDLGSIQLHLVITCFLAWFFTVLAIIKGVDTLGKVVYVTATAPFLLLTAIFIRGLYLEGAIDGIEYYLKPDFSKVITVQVWLDAAIQVFFALGPAWGGVITMASYSKFHRPNFWPSAMCVVFSGFTSLFNGLVVFTILGFMAHETGSSVEELSKQSGPGLVFIVFPTAISKMPFPHLWSVLFFLTLLTVAFDSEFAMLETVTSAIIDFYPSKLLSRRPLVNIIAGFLFFIASLPLTMNGGIYIFQLADWYFCQFALFVGVFAEMFSISWLYGTDRFSKDIALMTGRPVSSALRCMWAIVIPILSVIAFAVTLAEYTAPEYGDGYVYSREAIAIGIFIGLIPDAGFVFYGVMALLRRRGTFMERLRDSIKPNSHWQPNDRSARQTYLMKKYVYENTWWERFVINIRGPKGNPIV